MFAVLAAISFAVVLLHGHLGDVDLTVLGLLFLALHHAFGRWPWRGSP